MDSEISNTSADHESKIRTLYRQLMDVWNKGSGEAYAAPFAEEGDLVGLEGHQEIIPFHQQLFDTYVKGSRLVGKVRSVRFLTHEVAVMHAVGGTVMGGQIDIEPDRNYVQTLVAVKLTGGEWRLAAFQNTRAMFIGRSEESQALTEELREE